jgi:hypothetical protein
VDWIQLPQDRDNGGLLWTCELNFTNGMEYIYQRLSILRHETGIFLVGAAPIYSQKPIKWCTVLADCKPDLGHLSGLLFLPHKYRIAF